MRSGQSVNNQALVKPITVQQAASKHSLRQLQVMANLSLASLGNSCQPVALASWRCPELVPQVAGEDATAVIANALSQNLTERPRSKTLTHDHNILHESHQTMHETPNWQERCVAATVQKGCAALRPLSLLCSLRGPQAPPLPPVVEEGEPEASCGTKAPSRQREEEAGRGREWVGGEELRRARETEPTNQQTTANQPAPKPHPPPTKNPANQPNQTKTNQTANKVGEQSKRASS